MEIKCCSNDRNNILLNSSLLTLILLLAFLISGCGAKTKNIKAYDGPEIQDTNLAILQVGHTTQVVTLDGKELESHAPGRAFIRVLPGKHVIEVRHNQTIYISGIADLRYHYKTKTTLKIPFDAKARHKYMAKSILVGTHPNFTGWKAYVDNLTDTRERFFAIIDK